MCLERDGVMLLPSSRPIVKLQIQFQSVWLKGADYTIENQNFLSSINTTKCNELNLQFHVYLKIQYYVSSLKTRYPTGKFKKYQENVLLVEDLIVPGKGLEIDQNWLIGVYSMNCLENQRSG